MTLDVERPSGVRYEVEDRWTVSAEEPVSVGSELSVLVDREDPQRIAIDWDATRAIYREKTAERRKLLSTGIPIPAQELRPVDEPRRPVAVPMTRGTRGDVPVEPTRRPPPPRVQPPSRTPAAPEVSAGAELLNRLERLTALHAAGALTDAEFAAVKRHLLA